MAIITVELDPNKPLTEEQIKELEALKDRPITYDEDCPPLTEEELKQLRENGMKQRAIQKEFLEVYGPFEGYEGGNHEALQYLMSTALRYNIHLPYAIPHEIEFVFASAAKKYFADKGINRPFSLCPRVLHVRPLENYKLEISFNTGETRLFNVKRYLKRDEFQELKDPDFFKKAHQEHGAVVWDKTLVIDPETLYKNSKPDSNRQSKRVPEKERQKCFFPKEYRGYHAVIEYDAENKVYVGTIDGIRDLVTFEAESESELFTQFQEAVDDYIDFCATLQEGTKRVLSLKEISEKATPLAKQYGVKKLYLFGSYARGEAKPTSDVDFYIEKGRVEGLQLVSLQMAFEKALGKPVDLLTTGGMDDAFLEEVQPDEILLYTEDK